MNTKPGDSTGVSTTMKWLPYEGPGHPAKRYFFALLAALGGLYLRILLNPIYGDHYPYLTAFPAVMFAAWFCGVGPAILATLLAMGGTWYLLLPPHNSFALEQPKAQFAGIVGFLFFSSLIIAMGEGNRRNRIRLNQTLHDVLEARAELETRVHERTVEVNSATESVRELSGRREQLETSRLDPRPLDRGKALDVSPNGKYVYVTDLGDPESEPVVPGSVLAFAIDRTTGALSAVPGSPFTGGPNPKRIATDPSGKFVYVTNEDSDNMSVFSVNQQTGALTQITGSPFATGKGSEGVTITRQ